jgi:hypothetical protein
MSTGGLYQLIANDGKQDQMLMATELLNKRLKEIKRLRCKHPAIRDPTPTLIDIERTHIIYMNAHFKPFVAIAYEYNKIGVQEGITTFGSEVTFSIPQFGDFFHDMAVHVVLRGLAPGTVSTQARFCDFLGHRLFQRVRFEVNGNFLDEYTTDVYNFHYNFYVPENKRVSWKRCVGQELPNQTYLQQNPGIDQYRELKFTLDGPQTPKVSPEAVEMWIPLIFWFNKDPRLMIPSVSIPYGQRFIRIALAPVDLIAQGVPTPDFTPPIITTFDLYTNNIFVNPEIHDIFIKRIGFSLIRVHRYQSIPVSTNNLQIRLDNLKWPTECIFIGLTPNINFLNMEDWYRNYFVVNVPVPFTVAIPNPTPPPDYILTVQEGNYKRFLLTVDSIDLQTHGIQLYQAFPASFFNMYIPYTYGNERIGSPDDPGMMMVTFNLYPGAYQPSGHLNLSRSREFFLTYTSSIISSIIRGVLMVISIAINFLLISDGSAVLRYNL